MTDFFIARLDNKDCWFIRTRNNWFDITDCEPNNYGELRIAKRVSNEFVAEQYAKSIKCKASRIRKLRKEEAVN